MILNSGFQNGSKYQINALAFARTLGALVHSFFSALVLIVREVIRTPRICFSVAVLCRLNNTKTVK